MIEELIVENGQSHKHSKLKFAPGLNVITGPTDSGKSAIIRILDKIIYNNITSKELTSHWGGPLLISVKVDNNTVILKNDGKDSYTLNNTEFKAVGGKVPEEIQNVFNMENINFQNQIETFFLLNETSGYVASYLNKIANLSQIDSTIKAIKSELNETKRNTEHHKEDLKSKEIELEQYAFLSDLKVKIKEAEVLQKKVDAKKVEINALDYLITKTEDINNRLLVTDKIIALKPKVTKAISLINKTKVAEEKVNKLDYSISNLKQINAKIEQLNQLLKLKPLLSLIETIETKKNDLQAKLDTLDSFISKLSNIKKQINTANKNYTAEKAKYDSEMKKLNQCFFCGSKLN